MQLSSKRFLLRDFEAADRAAFVAYHADMRLRELYRPGENTPEHAVELLQLFQAGAAERPRENYQFAVLRHEGDLVGCAGLRMKNAEAGSGELGLELAPNCWGRFGYAIEIMNCLADFGFSEFGLNRIFGSTVSANRRIARLAQALGAEAIERDTPAWMLAKGWVQVEWQITRERWLARPSQRRF